MIACLYGPRPTLVTKSVSPTQSGIMQSPTKVITKKPTATFKLPDGVELTVSELQEMAARQQQQIETQQQMLVAKEQRVKYLKQQEQRNHQLSAENERLQRLRERVESQEMKLQKLRALRGQVDQQKINNSNLTSELESIRSLFNSKEKELSLAVAKVEQLTKQLEELRKGRINGVNGGADGQTVNTAAAIELDKLRRELLYRNKLNEQQNNKLAQQREMLSNKTEEIVIIDKRIAELQQRLHRKRLLNQQITNQINAANTAKQAQLRANNHKNSNRVRPFSSNIAAVEPYQHTPMNDGLLESGSGGNNGTNGSGGVPVLDSQLQEQQRTLDDLHTKLNSINGDVEELSEFQSNKNDPKYQTLPYNTKFTTKYGNSKTNEQDNSFEQINGSKDMEEAQNCQNSPSGQPTQQSSSASSSSSSSSSSWAPQTVHSIPTYSPPKALATAVSKGKKHNANYDNVTNVKVNQVVSQRLVYSSAYPVRGIATSAGSDLPYQTANGNVASQIASVNSVSVSSQNSSTSANGISYSSNQVPMSKASNLAAPPYIPPPTTNITLKLQNSPGNSSEKSSGVVSSASSSSNILQVKGPPLQLVSSRSINSGRPSTIYQTSSTRILPVTPHTLGTSAQGILCEVSETEKQDNDRPANINQYSTTNSVSMQQTTNENANLVTTTPTATSDSTPGVPKPSLPPKPCVPQKPLLPPRQLIHGSAEKLYHDEKIAADESESTVGNQRHDSKITFPSKTSMTLDQHLENSDSKSDSADHLTSNKEAQEVGSVSLQKKPIPSKLPIKPKPLTIKKQTGVEPPKLRSNGSSIASSAASKKMNDSIGGGPLSVTINNLWSGSANSNIISNNNRKAELYTHHLNSSGDSLDGGNNLDPQLLISSSSSEGNDVVDHALVTRNSDPSILEAYMDNGCNDKHGMSNSYQPVISTRIGHPLDRDKRRPYVESLDLQVLETNANNDMNSGNEHQLNSEIGDGHHQRLDIQFRPGPVGATIEENNNYDDGGMHNKSKETSPDMCNEDDGDKDSSSSSDNVGVVSRRLKKGNLKTHNSVKITRRVSFDPLALLLDAALEGELELVKKTALEVPNPSAANDEGITALHNAICAGHYEIVKFLVEFGCDVNAQDSDGWTPLHCAASCNNLPMVKFLVEHGACIFATTLSDHETAAEKCEEDEEGFDGCTEYLYSIQEKLGILNNGLVYALYDYQAHNADELDFKNGDVITVLRKGDEYEREWWWAKVKDQEGYIPRNLLGLFQRVAPCIER